MPNDPRSFAQHRIASTVAAAVVAAGLFICLAWWLDAPELTRLTPASTPVRFATGLCFVLLGVALLLAPGRHPVRALAVGAPVGMLAALTVASYVWTGTPWLAGWLAGVPPQGGPMAPNTAVAMLLASLGVAALVLGRSRIWALSIASVLATLTIALGLLATFGYAFALTSAFPWAGLMRMALLTALAVIVLGTGILMATRAVGRIASWVEQPWLASSVGIGALGLGLMASHALGAEVGLQNGTLAGLDAAAVVFAAVLAGTVAQARHMRLLTLRLAEANQRQAEQSALIADLYEHAPCGYHSLDAQGRFVRINRTELRWLGYESHELLGRRTLFDLLSPRSKKVFAANFPHFKELGSVSSLQLELVRKDGSLLPVVVSATAVYDAHGCFDHSRSTLFDDSQRRRFEQALRRSERRLQALVDNVQAAVLVHAPDSRIEFANPSAAQLLGISRERLLGRASSDPAWRFLREDGSPLPAGEHPVDRAIRSLEPVRDCVVGIVADNSTPRWLLVNAVPALGEDGRLREVIESFVDISDRQRERQHLEQLATTDALTGLARRGHLLELAIHELARARRSRQPLSLVLFDIDHFKQINDRHGHETGDRVLRRIGELLRVELRAADLAGRWGGEEFCVILPDTDLALAVEIAQRLCAVLARTPMSTRDGEALQVTASFGVAPCLPDEEDFHSLLEAADRAMYQAKRAGRNCVQVAPEEPHATPPVSTATGDSRQSSA